MANYGLLRRGHHHGGGGTNTGSIARTASIPPTESLSGEVSLATLWVYQASWLLLAGAVAYALSHISNINADGAYVTTGGIYSGTDGMWAEWNAVSIVRFGQFLDPSPFNAFSGMGSTYLPNLPWLNPGALMLALPLSRHDAFVLSYLVYMFELGAALTILARSIGFSWLTATVAAELHVLLLFPPFSAYFGPLEWYSAAPMYAQLTSVWCLALAAFMACGRRSGTVNAALAAGFAALLVAGDLSSPFSFIFFGVPFATLGLVLLLARPLPRRELLWKGGTIAGLIATAHLAGFTDYLLATAATSARTPLGAIQWGQLLSPSVWVDWLVNRSPCTADPRALMCRNDPLWWLQALALAGSLFLLFAAKGGPRAAGVWGILYLAGLHLYAYPYQAGVLGPVSTLSTHFLSWSAYAILPVLAVAGIVLAVRTLGRILWQSRNSAAMIAAFFLLGMLAFWGPWRAIRDSGLTGFAEPEFPTLFRIAAAFALWGAFAVALLVTAGSIGPTYSEFLRSLTARLGSASGLRAAALALSIIPVAAGAVAIKVTAQAQTPDDGRAGPITRTVARETGLGLGRRFRGYAATFWSPALDVIDESGMAARLPVFRYIHARNYFVAKYGTTFTETDLWRAGIPTFEEYGQWVSRQAQLLVKGLLDDTGKPNDPRFLRLYKLDIDIMRALGIRFLITDLAIDGDPRLTLRMKESAPDAFSVYLYELENPNLATYSPTQPIRVEMAAEAILPRMAAAANELDRLVFVNDALQGPFTPARNSSMTLKRDGYRVSAEADGRSLLLLPIQFSHCLSLTDHAGGEAKPRLYRANLAQTVVLFEGRLDATIEFDFGLFGNGACRLRDGREVAAMSKTP